MNLDFLTEKQRENFLKTRIDDLDLSTESKKRLFGQNIRTVGGIIQRNDEEVKSMLVSPESDFAVLKNLAAKLSAEEIKVKKPVEESQMDSLFDELVESTDVIAFLAKHFNLTKADVVQQSRKKELVRVRDIITYLLRVHGDMSFPAIGRLIDRDHTTIMHSYKKMQGIIASQPELEAGMGRLIAYLGLIKTRKERIQQQLSEVAMFQVATSLKGEATFKTISERELRILELWREGLTLVDIATPFRISRERVRQIEKR